MGVLLGATSWGRRSAVLSCAIYAVREMGVEKGGLLGWETVEGSLDKCRRSDGVNTQRGEKEVRVSDSRGGECWLVTTSGEWRWEWVARTQKVPSWASRTERPGCGLGHSWTLKSSVVSSTHLTSPGNASLFVRPHGLLGWWVGGREAGGGCELGGTVSVSIVERDCV